MKVHTKTEVRPVPHRVMAVVRRGEVRHLVSQQGALYVRREAGREPHLADTYVCHPAPSMR